MLLATLQGDLASSDWSHKWFDKVKSKFPYLDGVKVTYTTHMDTDYYKYMEDEALWPQELDLSPQLPKEVRETSWDVIVVDAPRGNRNSGGPGRFTPLYTAKLLSRTGTVVVVDDYERKIERNFSRKVLGKEPDSVIDRSGRVGVAGKNEQAYFIM